MTRRIVGAAAAVVLALGGTLVLLVYVKGARARAEAGEPQRAVLVVTAAIPKDAPLEQVRASIAARAMPESLVAPSALTDLEAVAGKVTAAPLFPGEQVVAERFISPEQSKRGDVPPGLLEVTVALPPERALGGRIERGDTVGVVVSLGEEDELPDTTHLLLHKVLVTHVQLTNMTATRSSSSKQASSQQQSQPQPQSPSSPQAQAQQAASTQRPQPTAAPRGAVLVTVALDAPSVERVVYAAEYGSLWLAAEPKDAPESGTGNVTRRSAL